MVKSVGESVWLIYVDHRLAVPKSGYREAERETCGDRSGSQIVTGTCGSDCKNIWLSRPRQRNGTLANMIASVLLALSTIKQYMDLVCSNDNKVCLWTKERTKKTTTLNKSQGSGRR